MAQNAASKHTSDLVILTAGGSILGDLKGIAKKKCLEATVPYNDGPCSHNWVMSAFARSSTTPLCHLKLKVQF